MKRLYYPPRFLNVLYMWIVLYLIWVQSSSFIFKTFPIGDFHNVFKFHAYSVNIRLFLTTAKLVRGLSDVATTNVCKVDTSNRNHIERSRWMKWLITGLRQKKYPLIWIHYESPLLGISNFFFYTIVCNFNFICSLKCVLKVFIAFRKYTEQWASKETYHFFRVTLTKIHCIKINHI